MFRVSKYVFYVTEDWFHKLLIACTQTTRSWRRKRGNLFRHMTKGDRNLTKKENILLQYRCENCVHWTIINVPTSNAEATSSPLSAVEIVHGPCAQRYGQCSIPTGRSLSIQPRLMHHDSAKKQNKQLSWCWQTRKMHLEVSQGHQT